MGRLLDELPQTAEVSLTTVMKALDVDVSTYIDDTSESETSLRYKCKEVVKTPMHDVQCPTKLAEVKKELSDDSGWGFETYAGGSDGDELLEKIRKLTDVGTPVTITIDMLAALTGGSFDYIDSCKGEQELAALYSETMKKSPKNRAYSIPKSGITKADGEATKVLVELDTTSNGNTRRAVSNSIPNSPIISFQIITINVGGLKFQTLLETLERYPNTLLGNVNKRRPYYNVKTDEYFFDRHRPSFETILYFYQSPGRLKRPETVPVDIFVKELKFFEMGSEVMENFWSSEGYRKPKEKILPKNPLQRAVFLLVEHPDSSCAARVVAFFSVFVIIVSTISFCMETIPELKNFFATVPKNNTVSRGTVNGTEEELEESSVPVEIIKEPHSNIEFGNPFFIIEFSCICWFTVEFTLRFLSCPTKKKFCKSFLNIIDFVAIVPFFLNLAMNEEASGGSMSFAVLRVFRLVRVFRVFKLSRHSRGLQILGKTFKASVQELLLLMFFMLIGLVLFSSAVYFAESGLEDTQFTSIPAAFWFSIVTMTTVGYGDLTPKGVYGKMVGSMCAIAGVLVLALPVPVIVANFKHFYRQENRLAHMRTLEGDENGAEEEMADDGSRSS